VATTYAQEATLALACAVPWRGAAAVSIAVLIALYSLICALRCSLSYSLKKS
jgi:small basic protein